MAFKQTNSKVLMIKSFMNTWLKDQTFYCNYCGNDFDAIKYATRSCCEDPQIGRNIEHMMGVCNQNKEIREEQLNDYGATKDLKMRQAVRMPPKLMEDLEEFFKKNYKEKLFNDNKELRKFTKHFPQFSVARKI